MMVIDFYFKEEIFPVNQERGGVIIMLKVVNIEMYQENGIEKVMHMHMIKKNAMQEKQ